MALLGDLLVGLADLVLGRGLRHPERGVGVVAHRSVARSRGCRRRHSRARPALSTRPPPPQTWPPEPGHREEVHRHRPPDAAPALGAHPDRRDLRSAGPCFEFTGGSSTWGVALPRPRRLCRLGLLPRRRRAKPRTRPPRSLADEPGRQALGVALRPDPLRRGIAVAVRPADGQDRLDPRQVLRRRASAPSPAASSRRCATERVPGIGMTAGLRASSQAMASAAALVPISAASAAEAVGQRRGWPTRFGSMKRGLAPRNSEAAIRSGVGGVSVRSAAADRREGDERGPERGAGLHQPELRARGSRASIPTAPPPPDAPPPPGAASDGAISEKPMARVLPARDQTGQRPGDLLDRHLRVAAVDVEEIDRLDAEPLQAALELGGEMRGRVVEPPPLRRRVVADRRLGGDAEAPPCSREAADHRAPTAPCRRRSRCRCGRSPRSSAAASSACASASVARP